MPWLPWPLLGISLLSVPFPKCPMDNVACSMMDFSPGVWRISYAFSLFPK